MISLLSATLVLILSVCCYFYKKNFDYWKVRGIPGPKPQWIFGNIIDSFLMKRAFVEIFSDLYAQYEDVPVFGAFRGSTPLLIIREPDLIKDIIVKNFNHFQDNDFEIDKNIDPLMGRNPFFLKGEEWKLVRSQLTPSFTSGKMKLLHPLLVENSKEMVRFISDQKQAFNGAGLESKELCVKFTLNNVGKCAFGLEAKCFEQPNPEFRDIAKKFLTPSVWDMMKILFITIIPAASKIIPIKFTPKEVEDRLTNIITQTLKYREDNGIVRNDFLNSMSELKKSSKAYNFTNVDVTAHAAGFFVDGYETSSTVMSFVLYYLGANPEVQAKLRNEINSKVENGKDISYEDIQEMPYLDGVISESLRLTPPIFALAKRCTSSFELISDHPKVKSFVIEKGTSIFLPVYGLQHDAKYYPDPETFKPERFIGKNKETVNKYTFLPFGEGPRACLGQRFGLLQIKIGLVHIIKHFEVIANKKTKVPFEFDPTYFIALNKGGLWVDFKELNSVVM